MNFNIFFIYMFTCIICLCIHTSLDYTFIHYISVYSPADDFSIMNLFLGIYMLISIIIRKIIQIIGSKID